MTNDQPYFLLLFLTIKPPIGEENKKQNNTPKKKNMPHVTEACGEVFCLRDVLERWGVCRERWEKMSRKWRCRIAAHASTEDAIVDCMREEQPCVLDAAYSSKVHAACSHADDGLELMLNPASNDLKRPKLAFNSSWGIPGADLIHESHLSVVHKLSEVFDHPADPTPRNLQMFHRQDANEPNIPILSSLLTWPPLLEETTIPCDRATRLSQKNALTTWHLDDCGEFVFQTALKIKKKGSEAERDAQLIGKGGLPVVKIFFCAPKWGYDFITQDQEQNRSGKFSQIDLWAEQSDRLPAEEDLPILTLSLVEAGGAPMLMYPNIPHTVLTLDDSVQVEERRISTLFLDEVGYFHHRSRSSTAPPVSYSFVSKDCVDPAVLDEKVVKPLLHLLADPEASLKTSALSKANKAGFIKDRAYAGLLSCMHFEEVFSLSETSRASIPAVVAGCNEDVLLKENLALSKEVSGVPFGVLRHHQTGHYYAYTHIDGAPVFGVPRKTLSAAAADRKALFSVLEFVSTKDNPDIEKALASLATEEKEKVVVVDEKTAALLDDLF